MENKSITYAEVTLGVHRVHGETVKHRNRLEELTSDLVAARARRRLLEEIMADHEADVQIDQIAAHPSMSATAMKEQLKKTLQKDDVARQLRENLRDLNREIDGFEYTKSFVEHDVRIGIARLTELGGYLQYLAAVKQSHTQTHSEGA